MSSQSAPSSAAVDVPARPSMSSDDTRRWLIGEGVAEDTSKAFVDRFELDHCVELPAVEPRAALLCHEGELIEEQMRLPMLAEPYPLYRRRTLRRLYVVRNAQPVLVFGATVHLASLVSEEPESGKLLDLHLALESNGDITLRDVPPEASLPGRDCDARIAELDERLSEGAVLDEMRAWDLFDRKLAREACAARGRYRWDGAVFVKVEK